LNTTQRRILAALELEQQRLAASIENERLLAAERLAAFEDECTASEHRRRELDDRVLAEVAGSIKSAIARFGIQQSRHLWDHTRATDAVLQLVREIGKQEQQLPSASWASLGPASTTAASAVGRPWIFVVPHPDDETLGAGATIADYVAAGAEVHVLLLTRGTMSAVLDQLNGTTETGSWWGGVTHDPALEGYRPLTRTKLGDARYSEFVSALGALGVGPDRIHEASFQSQALTVNDVKAAIRKVSTKVSAEVGLWAPSYVVDNHTDHVASGNAVRELCVEDPATFQDPYYYVLPAYWTDSRLSATGHMWDLPGNVITSARVRNACKAYSAWQPTSGAFAIGYHSVASMFAQVEAVPRVMYHR
jgi:LmbE family N-acetylglucosaminyl deacetylase